MNRRYYPLMAIAEISYEQLEVKALHLTREDRTKLTTRLLESLEKDDDFVLSPEWDAELNRRVRAMDDGTELMISSEEFWKDTNKRFGTNF